MSTSPPATTPATTTTTPTTDTDYRTAAFARTRTTVAGLARQTGLDSVARAAAAGVAAGDD